MQYDKVHRCYFLVASSLHDVTVTFRPFFMGKVTAVASKKLVLAHQKTSDKNSMDEWDACEKGINAYIVCR